MKTIWKFDLEVTDEQRVSMPAGAWLLCVQAQRDAPRLWAMVDPDALIEQVLIRTYGTGHPVDDASYRGSYIGTYQLKGGALVFHVFADVAADPAAAGAGG